MALKPNEMAILKAVSVNLDPDTVMVLTLMYHTELQSGPTAIVNSKGKTPIDRSKSQYRYEGFIAKKADLEAKIADAKANPQDPWLWPNLKDFCIMGTPVSSRKDEAHWLNLKLKKAVDWPTAQKILDGWKKSTNDFKDSRKYDKTGYTTDTNQALDITLEALTALGPGHTFTKVLTPKKA